MKPKKNIFLKFVLFLLVGLAIAGGACLYLYEGRAASIRGEYLLKLNENDNLETLTDKLNRECGLKFPFVFKVIAKRMNLEPWMKKGRYHLMPEMTLIDIVRLFREGRGKTVNFTIREMTDIESFIAHCGEKLEPDSADFATLLNDPLFLDSIGFNKATIYAFPLPDTYNLLWHTTPDELFVRLKTEYNKFWNSERRTKAENGGLTPIEVSTLASIVCKETNKIDEMPNVAGMYINRLKIDMPLQADPTVKFALNEPGLKRILNIHLNIVSPYNTYLNKGLPPGPICIPSKQSIEAVLNFTVHSYLYMCAKEDISGYHNFAVTYPEHLKNARKYQKALDNRGIK